jgi:hypothetical protein
MSASNFKSADDLRQTDTEQFALSGVLGTLKCLHEYKADADEIWTAIGPFICQAMPIANECLVISDIYSYVVLPQEDWPLRAFYQRSGF